MALLNDVPDSALWLLQDTDGAAARLRQAAESAGVQAGRLAFAPRVRVDEHLARHRAANLFLDTLPYGAHTTASDALWAGLPVLTCRGSTFPGRVGVSLLTALGLHDVLVADDLQAYRQRALALACDPGELRSIRRRLLEAIDHAPLFDTPATCSQLESAFREMVRRHAAGLPPQAFHVSDVQQPA
jgi:predicted O-linked N-acetylglucosamine transferase (SPINDLY family)